MAEQIKIDFKNVGALLAAPGINGNSQGAASSAPTGDMTDIETRVLALIQRGRSNAISMPALAEACGISTRELQSIKKHLVEDHGVLIVSSCGKNNGYYYPENAEEFDAGADQIIHRIISLAKLLRAMNKEKYEHIFCQGRIEL
jgi:hypothetical protein